MRIVLQRVKEAQVKVSDQLIGSIQQGYLLLVGIEELDGEEDIAYLIQKVIGLRVFSDEQGKMNLSIQDVKGELLIVSQFTLFASTKKGNRPSFIRSAKPEKAEALYVRFIEQMKVNHTHKIASGIFGADMQVSLVNDGPVTILFDSKNKE